VRSDLVSDASRTRGRSKRQIETYRSRFLWVARTKAWDAHQDEVRRRAQIQEHIVMGQRQATEAQAISAAMMIPIRELLRRMTDVLEVDQIKRLKLGDLLLLSVQTGRVWPQTMRAERLARGAPTPDYGAFLDDPEDGDSLAGSVLDDERHLGEVWLAMEEAGLSPRQRALPPADDAIESNGHSDA
jgi:hypothetical protein